MCFTNNNLYRVCVMSIHTHTKITIPSGLKIGCEFGQYTVRLICSFSRRRTHFSFIIGCRFDKPCCIGEISEFEDERKTRGDEHIEHKYDINDDD